MRRFIAVMTMVVVSACFSSLPTSAAAKTKAAPSSGKEAKEAKQATKADTPKSTQEASAEDPTWAEQIGKHFSSFCMTWMDKLRAREKYNIEHIQWRQADGGVIGEYVGYDTNHTDSVAHVAKKEVPIGKLIYRELKLKLIGSSEADALAKKPEILEQTEVTELFRYDRGIWVY
jgi:hypothetical protein